jgi:hypothetical protein
MDTIIKKNAPQYNKYRSIDNTKLYLQSLSLAKFNVSCYLVAHNGEFLTKDYEVGVGEAV